MSKLGTGCKVVLTGIGAYLVLSKGIRVLEKMVTGTQDAMKWRSYYKYGKNDDIPPNNTMPLNEQNEALKASVKKMIDDAFDRLKREIDPLQAQIEASVKGNHTDADKYAAGGLMETPIHVEAEPIFYRESLENGVEPVYQEDEDTIDKDSESKGE